jgi:hypothetical protein
VDNNKLPNGIIYGADDRLDIYELDPALDRRFNARCVLLMVPDDAITITGTTATLETRTYGEARNLCRSVKYWSQPDVVTAACSAFLVAPDLVATAAHCLEQNYIPLEIAWFIAGYEMTSSTEARLTFPLSDVYRPSDLLWSEPGVDAALIQLDRPLAGAFPAPLRLNGTAGHADFYAFGYPIGLPKKYSSNTWKVSPNDFGYETNLSVFSGNSGGPAFNADSHVAEGIVVRAPEGGLLLKDGCYVTNVAGWDELAKVGVLSSTVFAPIVPGYTTLTGQHSKLVLTIAKGSQTEGAALVQESWADQAQQWFRFDRLPGGWYRIAAAHSGQVLTVDGGAPQKGSPIVQRAWKNSDEQQFRVDRVGGWTVIRPKMRPGLCLDVKNDDMEPGGTINLYDWDDQINQKWLGGTPITNTATKLAANIDRGSVEEGAAVIQYRYDGGTNEIFYVEPLEGLGAYRIVARNGTGMCWEMHWSLERKRREVVMMPWTGSLDQIFQLEPAGNSKVKIIWPQEGKKYVRPESQTGRRLIATTTPGGLEDWRLQVSAPLPGAGS